MAGVWYNTPMKFLVEITEALQRIVEEEEASAESEAEHKVRECYRRGGIVLDEDDHAVSDTVAEVAAKMKTYLFVSRKVR